MKRWMYTALMGIAVSGVAGTTLAEETVDIGKHEYMSKCAVCHGEGASGEGPYADVLRWKPADLTTLARRNNGVFPFEKVYEVIDGRSLFPVHGTREMPIWGDAYRIESASYVVDIPVDPERFARTRILGLIDYIYRVQVK